MDSYEARLQDYINEKELDKFEDWPDSENIGNLLWHLSVKRKLSIIWEIIRQICDGLHGFHKNNIVHGNLNPSTGIYSFVSACL